MGYLAFDQLIYTDHRGVYIDFSTSALFGDNHVKLVYDSCRYIQTKDPKCVSTYINTVHKHLSNNNFWKLLSKLEKSAESVHLLAEHLDKLFI